MRAQRPLLFVITALALCGCGPRARLRDDPFRPPVPGSASASAATNVPPALDRGTAQNEASSRGSSEDNSPPLNNSLDLLGTPVAHEAVDSPAVAGGASEIPATSLNTPTKRAPSDTSRENPSTFAAATQVQPLDVDSANAEVYRGIRQRLNRVGAQNFRIDTDPTTGDSYFYCEVPDPNDPNVLRAFENIEPTGDAAKAMLAVTEKIEEWLAEQRR